MPDFTEMRLEFESKNNESKNKVRDIAVGIFDWIIFHNSYFLFVIVIGNSIVNYFGTALHNLSTLTLVIFLALPFIVVIVTYQSYFAKKRTWIGAGIIIAIFINIAIWIVLLLIVNQQRSRTGFDSFTSGSGLAPFTVMEVIINSMYPLPLGFFVFSQ